MSYYEKYLKYKNKYLELKEQIAGAEPSDDIKEAFSLLFSVISWESIPENVRRYIDTAHGKRFFTNIFSGKYKEDDRGRGTQESTHYRKFYYKNNLSDHPLITSELDDRSIIVSLNVEHCGGSEKKIREFVDIINKMVADVLSDVNIQKFVNKMISIKNNLILNLFINICSVNRGRTIIFNIQEGYSSLYLTLIKGLNGCKATKQICQNILKVNSSLDDNDMLKMGLITCDSSSVKKFNTTKSEKNIEDIEEFIKCWEHKVPTRFTETIISEIGTGATFFSLVVRHNSIHIPKLSGIGLDTLDLSRYSEIQLDKFATTLQESPANQSLFVQARPVMLAKKVAKVDSNLILNGIGFGSLILTCDGIILPEYGVLSCHLNSKRKANEFLLAKLQENNLDWIFDIFDYDFDSDQMGESRKQIAISELRTNIDSSIFTPLLMDFSTRYLGPFTDIRVCSIAGDFNMGRGLNRNYPDSKYFEEYGLTDISRKFKMPSALAKKFRLDADFIPNNETPEEAEIRIARYTAPRQDDIDFIVQVNIRITPRESRVYSSQPIQSTSDDNNTKVGTITDDIKWPSLKDASKMVCRKTFDMSEVDKKRLEKEQNMKEFELERIENERREKQALEYAGPEVYDKYDELYSQSDEEYEFKGDRNERASGVVIPEGAHREQRQRKGFYNPLKKLP